MSKKRGIYIAVILTLFAVLLIQVVLKYNPSNILGRDTSSYYHRYANRNDVSVAYVEDFWLNDTIKTTATILIPRDTAAYYKILQELHFPKPIDGVRNDIAEGKPGAYIKPCKTGCPEENITENTTKCDMLVSLYMQKTIYIFETQDKRGRHAIFSYVFRRISE